MSSTRAESWLQDLTYPRRLAAAAIVLAFVALAVLAGVVMTREEPDNPGLPLAGKMEQVSSSNFDLPMRELDYADAHADVYISQVDVPDLFRFYTQDVVTQGWTLVSGVEDAEGSRVVYLTRYDTVAMVQITTAEVARERLVMTNSSLDVEPDDIAGAESVLIVGQFRCTDESGTAVCIDYIVHGQ